MRVRAQLMMVMALDKCLGCHTCSITCKQAWTDRDGAEYMWFNNVETKPGAGYPRRWEDQDRWQGGWRLDGHGRLALRAGGRLKKLATIFGNLDLPLIDDYYEPWTYDYATLVTAPAGPTSPVITPRSRLTGKPMDLHWGPNWEDDLAGISPPDDPGVRGLEGEVLQRFEQVFLFYLPRICNHCVNPSCVASCPSGALYKREEDGVVLVDQDKCRWLALLRLRMPVQEGLLQPSERQGREVHLLLSGHGERQAHRVLRDLRGPAARERRGALRPRRRDGRR